MAEAPASAVAPEIVVRDVTPRLSLMTERCSTATKVELANRLVRAGVRSIEQFSSFVSPRLVPGLADAEAVFAGVDRVPGLSLECCIASESGLERAIAAGASTAWFLCGTNDFLNSQNIGRDLASALELLSRLRERADAAGIGLGSYAIGSFGDPWTGRRTNDEAAAVLRRLERAGAQRVIVADSFGFAAPRQIGETVAVAGELFGFDSVVLQIHDARGLGIAGVHEAIAAGVRHVDGALAGSGAHPAMDGLEVGGLCTEDLVQYLILQGAPAGGPDLSQLIETANWLAGVVPIAMRGFVRKAGALALDNGVAQASGYEFRWPRERSDEDQVSKGE